MRVLVAGGSGCIGRSTVEALIRHGIEVTAPARGEHTARTPSDLGATPLAGALTDTGVLWGAARQAYGMIHLGADCSEGTADVDRAAAEAMQDGAAAVLPPRVWQALPTGASQFGQS
ncbi:NAD-dependent epimerase/dehydratase family protein [Streptomyces sp. NPDC052036]|uniref:NAD-dependent epimerase/dehydratase family protein n=1 Tax=Streptomyces sp. NPDC052036 TaxID=3155171 RepID=UPI00341CC093